MAVAEPLLLVGRILKEHPELKAFAKKELPKNISGKLKIFKIKHTSSKMMEGKTVDLELVAAIE